MANNSRVVIQEPLDLPSGGKFPGVPAQIVLRAMSLLDEKQRLASRGLNGIIDLVGKCTIKPENFDPYAMPRFDVDVAMIKLRIISHGPNYNVEVTCPYCGKTNKEVINLDDLRINAVPEDFQPFFEIGPLPISGDVLRVKILTFGDIDRMEAEARKIMSKFPDYEGDPADVLNYCYKIVEINGEAVPFVKMKPYVENMSAGDSVYFDEMYDEYMNQYGIDTNIPFSCDSCGGEFIRSMPMNAEFFRPRYNVKKR